MKKILMLAACASQLLLLPQINAMNNNGQLGEIIVSQNFEINNGILKLNRDACSVVSRFIVRASTGETAIKIKRLYGLSEEAFAWTTSEHSHTEFKVLLSEALIRVINIFQYRITNIFPRRIEKIVVYRGLEDMAEKMYGKDMAEKMYLNGCFIGAGNDVAPLLVFYGYISSNVFFKSYYLHRDGKNKTLRPCTDGLPSIGIRFGGQPLHIQAIKSINRKIFVFSKKNIRNSTDIYFAESANGDDFNWVPFFRSSRKDLSIENERAMAYGGGRYVLIANGGIVFTKTEKDNGEWKGSGAWKEFRISISNMIAKNATTFKNINIVYGNNMFALAFCSYDDKTYFYTSPNGEVWHHKIEEGSRLDTLTSFAGGSFGFALTNIAGELCYSKSFDDLIKVERKVAEKVAEYEAEFHTVFCINSFFGCTFVALMKGIGGGCDILLGIPVRKEGNISDIKWLKTDSRIYISNDGYVRNINKDIRNIFSNTDGDIITIGGKVSDKKWVTWS